MADHGTLNHRRALRLAATKARLTAILANLGELADTLPQAGGDEPWLDEGLVATYEGLTNALGQALAVVDTKLGLPTLLG